VTDNHPLLSLFAGDDWQINVLFLDVDDTPLDLTSAVILWTMLDAKGHAVIAPGGFAINLGADPGQCVLTVPATTTTAILAGSYTDYWRLVIGGVTTTMLRGGISVDADPWGAAAQPVAERVKPVINIVARKAA
jgi:hypothetical protein